VLLHAIALLAAATADAQVPREVDPAALLDGDVAFHTSTTSQAQAIVWATASPYAHVGLVERAGEQVYVVEAVQPVKRTAWAEWTARGLGGQVTVMRHRGLSDAARESVVDHARRYLGRPYDLSFAPGADRLYCSELVHLAYAAVGVQLGTWTPASELGLASPPVQALLRSRWRRHPACAAAASLADCMPALGRTRIVTPASLRADPQLTLVASSYPPALR
jgi:hypothetical protein